MKVICVWHKPEPVVIAETCPTPGCGQRASIAAALDLAYCENPNCPTFCFPIGEGGFTHTMCDECKAAMLEPELVEQVA